MSKFSKSRSDKGFKKDSKSNSYKKKESKTFQRYRDEARPSELSGSVSKREAKPYKKNVSENRPDFKEKSKKNERDSDKPFFKKQKEGSKEESSRFKNDGDKPFFKKEKPGSYNKFKSRDKSLEKKPFKKQEEEEFDFDDFYEDEKKELRTIKHARPYERKPYAKKTFHKKNEHKPDKPSSDGTIRLNKYIANAGICSRREADELIATGVVSVNGKIITEMGFKIKPTDIIKYGGQTLKKERMVYLLLNKPKDYISTIDDPQKRRTVLELVQGACKERIYPVGRLDRATTGLLLFTNDGELTKKLTHPRYGVRKLYHIELDKPLKKADYDKIVEGVELEDGLIKVDEISYVGDGKNKSEIGLEIHSGKNRIVRRLFEHFGYNVRKLDRVMFGPLTKKDLPRGRWRFITEAELGMLKMVSVD